ncbi:TraB/GumN family protein [Sphingobium limneticum]|uniref:TraB/GumN family protein n=1 Tax=Sphingobium limneticum TaxID=1007511 RepID=A0A5J5I4K6_9SPHN|nr:TraB/GumN family protein [Sphingobium limneticum]KAA9029007.1 TraB/GumN family protein [Sphingobium limneticum]
MRIATRLLALFALTLVAACGQDSKPVAKVEGGPALWQVQRGELNGWLFGTIHVLPKGVAWDTPAIKEAMGASDRLILEAADLQDEQKTLGLFEKMGRSPGLPPLEKRVPDGEKAALRKAMADGGTNSQLLSGYESWAAAMLLSAASQQGLGVSQSDGVEPVLIETYKKAKKPIGGLETVERQFAAFDTLPETAQSALLVQTVHEAKGMKALYDRILTAWSKGDMEAIAKEDKVGEQPDPVVEEAILVARNRDWVKAIEPMKGRPFIAVGAGHLTGRENLIELLKTQGYTITRVQ